MKTFADDAPIVHKQRTNHRIGTDEPRTSARKLERALHQKCVCIEHVGNSDSVANLSRDLVTFKENILELHRSHCRELEPVVLIAHKLWVSSGRDHRRVIRSEDRARIIYRRAEVFGVHLRPQRAVTSNAASQNNRPRMMTAHRGSQSRKQRSNDFILEARDKIDDSLIRLAATRERLDFLLSHISKHGRL